jgi:aryl-alcohol dehydrogenase-like predicted oxidoreductase
MNLFDTSRVVLGTVQFGLHYGINNLLGKPSTEEVTEILSLAKKYGVKCLDTADAYGDSQKVLRKAGIQDFKILSKFILSDSKKNIKQCLEKTLETLGTSSLDSYSFHRFSDYQRLGSKEACEIKSAGKIKSLGLSLYSSQEMHLACADPSIDLIQVPFNLLDNYNLREIALKLAKKNKKTVHVRSIFLQGLFFKEPQKLTGNLKVLEPYLLEIKKICQEHAIGIEELCLGYALSKSEIDAIVLGVDSAWQFEKNIESLEKAKMISAEVWDKVDAIRVENTEILNPSNWNPAN